MGHHCNREQIYTPSLNTVSDKTYKTMALKTLDHRKQRAVTLKDRIQMR